MSGYSRHNMSGFSLIEVTTSLVIMSILMLGLASAVMIASKAIPSPTQYGLVDDSVVNTLSMIEHDAVRAASIGHTGSATSDVLTLNIKSTGQAGEPTVVVYTFDKANGTISRTVDARGAMILVSGVSTYTVSPTYDGTSIRFLAVRMTVPDSIQKLYERFISLPDKPGVV